MKIQSCFQQLIDENKQIYFHQTKQSNRLFHQNQHHQLVIKIF